MAGDWIKVEHTIFEKPEVFAIARSVGQSRTEVAARLLMFWMWADQQSIDGTNLALTSKDVDDLVGLPGLAVAMRAQGWLDGRDGALQLPNFERHNGNSAKARALEKEAKRLRRSPDKVSDNTSDICPTKPAVNVGLDKRREQEIHGPCSEDHLEVDVSEVMDTVARIFQKTGYTGKQGGNLWKAAAANHAGLISDAHLWDACEGARLTGKNPAAVFYTRLGELLASDSRDIKALFKSIKLRPNWPKEAPKQEHATDAQFTDDD